MQGQSAENTAHHAEGALAQHLLQDQSLQAGAGLAVLASCHGSTPGFVALLINQRTDLCSKQTQAPQSTPHTAGSSSTAHSMGDSGNSNSRSSSSLFAPQRRAR